MAGYNWVDYVFILIFFFSVFAGFARGFLKEVISLGTIIAAFIVAILFSNTLASHFTHSSNVQAVVSQASTAIGMNAAQPVSYIAIGVSFGLLFFGTTIVGAIISFFLQFAVQAGMLGFGNRVLGAAFGFARGFIINLVLIFVVQLTSFSSQPSWTQSQLVGEFQPAVAWLAGIVSPSLATLKSTLGQKVKDVGSQIQGISTGILK